MKVETKVIISAAIFFLLLKAYLNDLQLDERFKEKKKAWKKRRRKR